MKRIRLDIEYLGTNYVGWQYQPNGLSIQQCIEDAIFRLTGQKIRIVGSGRTDAGVHALGQVAHFDTESSFKPFQLVNGLNHYLPSDIAITDAREVEDTFHARFSAIKRHYRYFISRRPTAVNFNTRWIYTGQLNFDDMNAAAKSLLGTQDFKSFCSVKAEVNHYLCLVEKAEWHKNGYDWIFEISANRFLHGMVRTIVGTLIQIGKGKQRKEDILKILEARDRKKAGFSAPPQGLFLTGVDYAKNES